MLQEGKLLKARRHLGPTWFDCSEKKIHIESKPRTRPVSIWLLGLDPAVSGTLPPECSPSFSPRSWLSWVLTLLTMNSSVIRCQGPGERHLDPAALLPSLPLACSLPSLSRHSQVGLEQNFHDDLLLPHATGILGTNAPIWLIWLK